MLPALYIGVVLLAVCLPFINAQPASSLSTAISGAAQLFGNSNIAFASTDSSCWSITSPAGNLTIWTSDSFNCSTSFVFSAEIVGPHAFQMQCTALLDSSISAFNLNGTLTVTSYTPTSLLAFKTTWSNDNPIGTVNQTYTLGCAALQTVGLGQSGVNTSFASTSGDCLYYIAQSGSASVGYRSASGRSCSGVWTYADARPISNFVTLNETCDGGKTYTVYKVTAAFVNPAVTAQNAKYTSAISLEVVQDTSGLNTVGSIELWSYITRCLRSLDKATIGFDSNLFAGTFSNDEALQNRVVFTFVNSSSLGDLSAPASVWFNGSQTSTSPQFGGTNPTCKTSFIAWQQLGNNDPETLAPAGFELNCTYINTNLYYRGTITLQYQSPRVIFTLNLNTFPTTVSKSWPAQQSTSVTVFNQTLTTSMLIAPNNYQLDNGQCLYVTSTTTTITAPALLFFRVTPFLPVNITATTNCVATLGSLSSASYNYNLTCDGSSSLFYGVVTNTSAAWTTAAFATALAPRGGSFTNIYSLYSTMLYPQYKPFIAGAVAVQMYKGGACAPVGSTTSFLDLSTLTGNAIQSTFYFQSLTNFTAKAAPSTTCWSFNLIDGSSAIQRIFTSGSAPAASVTNYSVFFVFPQSLPTNATTLTSSLTYYVTVDNGATFSVLYLGIQPIFVNTTNMLFTSPINGVSTYFVQSNAYCTASVTVAPSLPSPTFNPPFLVIGNLSLATPLPVLYPMFVDNGGYASAIANVLGTFSYRVKILKVYANGTSGSVLTYQLSPDPWSGVNFTLTESTVFMATTLATLQQSTSTTVLTPLLPNIYNVPTAPYVTWRCLDQSYSPSCAPNTTTPTPAPSSTSVSVYVSLECTVTAAYNFAFQLQVTTAIATFLGIDVARVSIGTVLSGSAILQIVILPPISSGTNVASQSATSLSLANTLIAAVNNPQSPLKQAVQTATSVSMTSNFVASIAVTVLCVDGKYRTLCPLPNVTVAPTAPAPSIYVQPTVTDPTLIIIGAIICGGILLLFMVYFWYRKRVAAAQALLDTEMSNLEKEH